jgi:hypothetical protein
MATGDFMGRTRPSTLNKFAATIPITGISNFLQKAPEACGRAGRPISRRWNRVGLARAGEPLPDEASHRLLGMAG